MWVNYNVDDVPMVQPLRDLKLFLAIEPPNGSEMNITCTQIRSLLIRFKRKLAHRSRWWYELALPLRMLAVFLRDGFAPVCVYRKPNDLANLNRKFSFNYTNIVICFTDHQVILHYRRNCWTLHWGHPELYWPVLAVSVRPGSLTWPLARPDEGKLCMCTVQ